MATTPQLLLTKLQPPRLLASLVKRERLNARLEEANEQLILVSAPAGFGKTTVVADWLGEHKSYAWLSLDEDDNDPRRFLLHLLAALQKLEPVIGRSVQALLSALPQFLMKTAVTTLINDISVYGLPIYLVLDDYHLIDAWPVHEAVQFLLDHQPGNLQLIIITREDPPLSLPRLRARQQLLELRAAELRFSLNETERFLKPLKLDLPKEVVRALERRTEGWAAGLHLVALSLKQSPDPLEFVRNFAGEDRYVLDYLIDEVFAKQSEEVQDFLLKTSVLERFSAPLSNAVVYGGAHGKSAELIAQLEHNNLFIFALDGNHEWFRYHHLFSELLRHSLSLRYPAEVAELHRRASRWHAEHGDINAAVKHALAADDSEGAAALLEKQLLSLLSTGTLPALTASLSQLPAGFGKGRPWLAVAQAWVAVHAGQLPQAQEWLRETAQVIGPGDNNLKGHALAVKTYLKALLGDMAAASELAKEALELLAKDAFLARTFTLIVLGAAHRFSAQLEAAVKTYEEGRQLLKRHYEPYLQVLLNCSLAEALRMQGKLHQAERVYREAIEACAALHGGSGEPPWFVGYAMTGLAAILQEWNRLNEAQRYASEGMRLCEKWGQVDALVISYLDTIGVCVATGDMDAAHELSTKAVAFAREVSPWPLAMVLACQARVQLALGNISAVQRWAEEAALSYRDIPNYQHELLYLTLSRLLLTQGKAAQALSLLQRLSAQAEEVGSLSSTIESLVLQTLALQAQGEQEQALTCLERALQLAEPEGFMRLFLNEGQQVAKPLFALVARGAATPYYLDLLNAFSKTDVPRANHEGKEEPLEPLSPRELEVLALIAEGLSNGKIAQRLHLSVNTVKAHSYNIYSKLAAGNRTEAVARARLYGVLKD